MEFACSHVVCNWRPDNTGAATSVSPVRPASEHHYDNRVTVRHQAETAVVPPPLPPRRLKTHKPRPISLPVPPPPRFRPPSPPSLPPPVPPRDGQVEAESRLKANVNVLSLSVGKLVDISNASGLESFHSPVNCGKCSAALSALSSVRNNLWVCEFCGRENHVDKGASGVCAAQRRGVCADVLHLPSQSDDDYQNLEDTLVVFCVDTSGSMSVTTEVTCARMIGSPTYISRLKAIQDALQRALSSLLQHSPRRRVALVTFSDEVVIYGDGGSAPLYLRDWALVDYDHIWQQGMAYSIPHCIAETHGQLTQRVKELREHGATCLGPAALVSVAMASRYPGSKVILCTDGRANIGLGEMEQNLSSSSPLSSYFYKQLAAQATESGVIISVMTFEGTDCRLAEVGRLADTTGGRVNIVNIGTVATEIQSDLVDNVRATGVMATLLAPDGVYFPFEDENNHKLVRDIGNATEGLEITFQFAVKPECVEGFLKRDKLPFQLQLSFKTRDHQRVTRIITQQRRVTTSSRVWVGGLNMAVLGVHCAQLCARLTMEGRVQEAQRQLKLHQGLLKRIRKQRPIQQEESIYSNWMDTMTTICDDITTESLMALSDEAAKVVYQMKRASSVNSNSDAAAQRQRQDVRKNLALMGGMST
ncbi:circularly permutated Ras protein 1 isoform X2 [Myripristis murdjan]|uniref:circularly permutated Ras protein 1 isoform X2 n=1 Tax=Myripristis murdjan TaxID=586833 RepID=UPI00117635A3|nr:circularly permutated Ras protein 1-like isoform X2 [Myripristis murdjan]